MTDLLEQPLGRYRLVSLIGEGGMGKVYKGYDAALERNVAIKILPAEVVADETRVTRFVQEARAASALNHPHVVSIYDIGEEGRVRYIAMELIDGKTLRELASDPLDVRKALKIVGQVADALTAAHAAGIIHRDLKPDNIMVTSSGYAKVLDFGLAKLRINEPAGDKSATVQRGTDPGVVMGTAGYMSPEQAQGKAVDHRSDIFSLGCVLYELVTGRRAFRGDSSVDTLHKIIYADPESVRALRPDTPAELVRIIRKALAKDPDERYQSVKDLAIDVRDLLRDIESNPSVAALTAPAVSVHRRGPSIWIAAVVALLAAAAAIAWFASRPRDPVPAAEAPMRMTRVTASGKVISAAMSPDTRFVAYVVADQGEQSLWVRQMSSGQSLQLVPPTRSAYWGTAFAPDGSIFYGMKSRAESTGAMYQISALGGDARKIISGIDSQAAFSPDGKRMAFLRARWPKENQSAIIVAGIDGSNEKVLATAQAPEFFVPIFFAGVSWSPDGKQIAAPLVNRQDLRGRIVSVDVETGTMRPIAEEDWISVAQVAWMPDQRGLVAIAQRRNADASQVWYVTYPEGKVSPITNDLFDYRIVNVSADGKSLLTIARESTSDLWIVPHDGAPKRITAARLEGGFGVDVSRQGRIAFTSLESGKIDIWAMNADGSGRTVLTRDEHDNRYPVFTPDGKTIVYVSITAKGTELCRMNADGSQRRVLATTFANASPDVSPDGKWVVYEHPEITKRAALVLARVPIDGGAPEILSSDDIWRPAYSPDGTGIAAYTSDEDHHIHIFPASGGAALQKLSYQYPYQGSKIRWTRDGSALVVNTAPSDRANLWLLPLDGSKARRLTNFDERSIVGFAALPDDRGWVVSRGEVSRDAVMITGFEP